MYYIEFTLKPWELLSVLDLAQTTVQFPLFNKMPEFDEFIKRLPWLNVSSKSCVIWAPRPSQVFLGWKVMKYLQKYLRDLWKLGFQPWAADHNIFANMRTRAGIIFVLHSLLLSQGEVGMKEGDNSWFSVSWVLRGHNINLKILIKYEYKHNSLVQKFWLCLREGFKNQINYFCGISREGGTPLRGK